jgi:putative glycosyltransferase (TIGR04372 family)
MTLNRAIGFGVDQLRKTALRPYRLILIPAHMLARRLARLEAALILLRRKLVGTARSLQRGSRPAAAEVPTAPDGLVNRLDPEILFVRAVELLDQNLPAEAWEVFSKGLGHSDNYFFFRTAAICLHHGLGRMREAIAIQRRSDEVRLARAAGLGIGKSRYRVLDKLWIEHFGHAAQVDYILKRGLLDGLKPEDTILYFPPDMRVANRFLASLWAPHVRMVTRPEDLPFPEKELEYHALNFFVPGLDGPAFYLWEVAAQTYRRWHEQGRGPILTFPPEMASRGWDALASVGVPRDAWFVGLHVRDSGFHSHHRTLHNVLNASIADYLPAIREITRRGGWVIRMGDPSMPKLAPLPNVLDYCHSSIRSDWMDVFLAASCRFFVGTSSGVCYAAQNYGVPNVLTNWWPPAQRPWHPGDLFIPKRHRRVKDNRLLSLAESIREPFGYCNSLDYLRSAHGVTIEDNDPEDIRAAVVEMMERIEGRDDDDRDDVARRKRANGIYRSAAMELYGSSGAFGASGLARDFLRRNPSFLET